MKHISPTFSLVLAACVVSCGSSSFVLGHGDTNPDGGNGSGGAGGTPNGGMPGAAGQASAGSAGASGSPGAAGGSAGAAGGLGGAGGSAGSRGTGGLKPDAGGKTGSCGGLGCPSCPTDSSTNIASVICTSTAACQTTADCSANLPRLCISNLGAYPTEFFRAACLGGQCAYFPAKGGCSDGTPCAACPVITSGLCGLKASAAECATCCEAKARVNDYAPYFKACACGSGGPCAMTCATSPVCGGAGPETNDCVTCLAHTLLDGGSCVASAAFQTSCVQGNDTGCTSLAQCLATCPIQ